MVTNGADDGRLISHDGMNWKEGANTVDGTGRCNSGENSSRSH